MDACSNAKLAYAICGIDQDGEGTVTFLPAFGENYVRQAKPPHIKKAMETRHDRCIHNHTWTEIIEIICKDPHVFDGCLKNGCVKSMPLFINKTLRSTGWLKGMYECEVGDGPSALLYEIAKDFCIWQPGHGAGKYKFGDNSGGWPVSRLRAVLNGRDRFTKLSRANSKNLADIRKITRDNCLLSCFPQEVQESIIPKAVRCAMNGDIVTIYDKLWLPSMSEMGYRTDLEEGEIYHKFDNAVYEEARFPWLNTSGRNFRDMTGDIQIWLRSSYLSSYQKFPDCAVQAYGKCLSYSETSLFIVGLAPGFVIGKKKMGDKH